jgi:hypothetical protein
VITRLPEIHDVPVSQLMVDPEVQRSLDKRWVDARIADYQDQYLGVLAVSDRGDGTFHVMDGMHRRELTIAAGFGEKTLRCLVYKGLDRSDEAAMFRHLNNKRNVQPLDKFRIRIIEADPIAVDLSTVLIGNGWKLSTSKGGGCFSSVTALEKVYMYAPGTPREKIDHCRMMIEVITAAWGHDSDGVRAEIVSGVGALINRYQGELDLAKLTSELGQSEGGPLVLVGRARSLRSIRGGTVGDALAEILVTLVNKGRRVHKIPEWRTV